MLFPFLPLPLEPSPPRGGPDDADEAWEEDESYPEGSAPPPKRAARSAASLKKAITLVTIPEELQTKIFEVLMASTAHKLGSWRQTPIADVCGVVKTWCSLNHATRAKCAASDAIFKELLVVFGANPDHLRGVRYATLMKPDPFPSWRSLWFTLCGAHLHALTTVEGGDPGSISMSDLLFSRSDVFEQFDEHNSSYFFDGRYAHYYKRWAQMSQLFSVDASPMFRYSVWLTLNNPYEYMRSGKIEKLRYEYTASRVDRDARLSNRGLMYKRLHAINKVLLKPAEAQVRSMILTQRTLVGDWSFFDLPAYKVVGRSLRWLVDRIVYYAARLRLNPVRDWLVSDPEIDFRDLLARVSNPEELRALISVGKLVGIDPETKPKFDVVQTVEKLVLHHGAHHSDWMRFLDDLDPFRPLDGLTIDRPAIAYTPITSPEAAGLDTWFETFEEREKSVRLRLWDLHVEQELHRHNWNRITRLLSDSNWASMKPEHRERMAELVRIVKIPGKRLHTINGAPTNRLREYANEEPASIRI